MGALADKARRPDIIPIGFGGTPIGKLKENLSTREVANPDYVPGRTIMVEEDNGLDSGLSGYAERNLNHGWGTRDHAGESPQDAKYGGGYDALGNKRDVFYYGGLKGVPRPKIKSGPSGMKIGESQTLGENQAASQASRDRIAAATGTDQYGPSQTVSEIQHRGDQRREHNQRQLAKRASDAGVELKYTKAPGQTQAISEYQGRAADRGAVKQGELRKRAAEAGVELKYTKAPGQTQSVSEVQSRLQDQRNLGNAERNQAVRTLGEQQGVLNQAYGELGQPGLGSQPLGFASDTGPGQSSWGQEPGILYEDPRGNSMSPSELQGRKGDRRLLRSKAEGMNKQVEALPGLVSSYNLGG